MGFTEPDSAPQPPGQMAAEPRSGPAPAPYYGGAISPIDAHGDADAGGRDIAADSVPGSEAAASARLAELEHDTFGQGSTIGDLVPMPPSPLDPAASSPGTTDPSGSFYDPPRGY